MAEFDPQVAVNESLNWNIQMNLNNQVGPFAVTQTVNGSPESFTVPAGGAFVVRLNVSGAVIAARALTRAEFEAEFNPAP